MVTRGVLAEKDKLVISIGADFIMPFTLYDDTEMTDPFDLSSYTTFEFKVRTPTAEDDAVVTINQSHTIGSDNKELTVTAASGIITVKVYAAVTELLSPFSEGIFELDIGDGTNKTRVVIGPICAEQDVNRA